jgi:hypothetical protein
LAFEQQPEMAMKRLKLIAAVLAVLAVSACVGVVVPVPISGTASSPAADRAERR